MYIPQDIPTGYELISFRISDSSMNTMASHLQNPLYHKCNVSES